MLKSIIDLLLAIGAVIIIGAMMIAIPILGIVLAGIAAVSIIYLVIKEETKYPRK